MVAVVYCRQPIEQPLPPKPCNSYSKKGGPGQVHNGMKHASDWSTEQLVELPSLSIPTSATSSRTYAPLPDSTDSRASPAIPTPLSHYGGHDETVSNGRGALQFVPSHARNSPITIIVTPYGPVACALSPPLVAEQEVATHVSREVFSRDLEADVEPASLPKFRKLANSSCDKPAQYSARRFGINPNAWPGNFRAGMLSLLTKSADKNPSLDPAPFLDDLDGAVAANMCWHEQGDLDLSKRPRDFIVDENGPVFDDSRTMVQRPMPPEHEYDSRMVFPFKLSTSTSGSGGYRRPWTVHQQTSHQSLGPAYHDTVCLPLLSGTPNSSRSRSLPSVPDLPRAPLLSHPINYKSTGASIEEDIDTQLTYLFKAQDARLRAARIHRERQVQLKRRKLGLFLAFVGLGGGSGQDKGFEEAEEGKAKGFFKPTLSGRGWRVVASDGATIVPDSQDASLMLRTGRRGKLARIACKMFPPAHK